MFPDADATTQITTGLATTNTDDDEASSAVGVDSNTSGAFTYTQTHGFLGTKVKQTYVEASSQLKANASNVFTKIQFEAELSGVAHGDDVLAMLSTYLYYCKIFRWGSA